VKRVWQQFALKVAAWVGAALAVHFLTTLFLGAPPDHVVPGILLFGALHIGVLDRTPLPAGNGMMLKRGVALLMVTFALWLGTNPGAESKIPWLTYSDEALEAARRGGRPVMLEFTSPRCPYCLAMDRKVFSTSRVAEAAKEFLPMRIEVNETNVAAQTLAEKTGVQGFPTILFIGRDGQEKRILRLEGYEDAARFAQRLEAAR
jgi:thiol:disulfide interchange protein DsbD